MLKRVDLNGFKCWRGKTTVELRPLTVLTGANSSGKSSVIQAILMAAQTLQTSSHQSSVVLNGPLARLGSFRDVVSEGRRSMGLAFELDVSARNTTLSDGGRLLQTPDGLLRVDRNAGSLRSVEVKFDLSVPGVSRKSLSTLDPLIRDSTITLVRDDVGGTEPGPRDSERTTFGVTRTESKAAGHAKVEREDLDEPSDAILENPVYRPSVGFPAELTPWERTTGETPNVRVDGVTMLHFLPRRVLVAYDQSAKATFQLRNVVGLERGSGWYPPIWDISSDPSGDAFMQSMNSVLTSVRDVEGVEQSAKKALDALVTCHEPEVYGERLRRFFREASSQTLGEVTRTVKERTERPTTDPAKAESRLWMREYRSLDDSAEQGVRVLRDFFRGRIRYLGPLREQPRAFYPESSAPDARDVGTRGERTAEVLYGYREEAVASVDPTAPISGLGQTKRVPLVRAVQEWLRYLGVADSVAAHDQGVLGFALEAAAPGQLAKHGLIHLGTGVSQVLPILVMALLAPNGSLLMFEQPELHLHPKVQARLADFFYAMTLIGKQCLVETHSEYVVDRLRYLCAAGKAKSISDNTIIYFAENASSGSSLRSIRIDEEGSIPEWPEGFFDESQHLSLQILHAGSAKRKRSSSGSAG